MEHRRIGNISPRKEENSPTFEKSFHTHTLWKQCWQMSWNLSNEDRKKLCYTVAVWETKPVLTDQSGTWKRPEEWKMDNQMERRLKHLVSWKTILVPFLTEFLVLLWKKTNLAQSTVGGWKVNSLCDDLCGHWCLNWKRQAEPRIQRHVKSEAARFLKVIILTIK